MATEVKSEKGLIWAGTGHRPDKLGGYDLETYYKLVRLATHLIKGMEPTLMITGGAMGWDQALAEASMDLGVPYHVYVPFKGQEGKWGAQAQARYQRILANAQHVRYVCDPGYSPKKMYLRNEAMVDNAQIVIALWNGDEDGGTAGCLNYVKRTGKPWRNAWNRWIKNDY